VIFLDDSRNHWIVATTRRELLDALLEHLPDEPSLNQLAKIAAGCLDCLETDIVVREEGRRAGGML